MIASGVAHDHQPLDKHSPSWTWLGPVVYVLALGLYFIGRYGGQWAEFDSASFSQMIRTFVSDGRLIPSSGAAYPNGYAYQAISSFLLAATGLDVAPLMQLVYPLTACLAALPAWILFRELTESPYAAMIATVLLFAQPEFLFVVLRSSHEKFTRSLMLLCLYFLIRSFKLRTSLGLLAIHIVLFYLAAYAAIAGNNLMANSFIFAIALALAAGWVIELCFPHLRIHSVAVIRRLIYVLAVCLGLVFIFTFYAYQPAQHDLLVLQDIGQRIAALFLDVQTKSVNAYAQVASSWVSLPIFILVSLGNWLILLASAAIWLHQAFRWLWRKEVPDRQSAWLLWLLYAAFALQGAFSVVTDASGALAANLQYRIFPSISIVAVALVATQLANWRQKHVHSSVRLLIPLGISCVAILSVLKATNDPLVSNKWTFYRSNEIQAIAWNDRNLRNSEIWTDVDERVIVANLTVNGDSPNRNTLRAFSLRETTRALVVSSVTTLRNDRLRAVIPLPDDALRIYDNGEVQSYHLRPETPFQR